jgi:antitoxin component YwqK of YwqJK toxin-antitoxin module
MTLRKPAFIILILSVSAFTSFAQTDTIFNQTDARNLKQGWWKKMYPNGKLMYKGYFKDNKPVGEMRRYYETGELKAKLLYDANGTYTHAKLLYADGQIAAEGWFCNSLKDSTWLYYSYYNHSLTAREVFAKGLRNGLMQHFYANGNLSEELTWVNNKKEGTWSQYFSNEVLKLKGFYSEGKLQGDFLVNYETGKPYLKGSYKNDLREGKWVFFTEDGAVDRELMYDKGKTPNEDKLDDKQQELFQLIDENKGKFEEPDETNFLTPGGR